MRDGKSARGAKLPPDYSLGLLHLGFGQRSRYLTYHVPQCGHLTAMAAVFFPQCGQVRALWPASTSALTCFLGTSNIFPPVEHCGLMQRNGTFLAGAGWGVGAGEVVASRPGGDSGGPLALDRALTATSWKPGSRAARALRP